MRVLIFLLILWSSLWRIRCLAAQFHSRSEQAQTRSAIRTAIRIRYSFQDTPINISF